MSYNSELFWSDLVTGVFASMIKESSKGEEVANSGDIYNVMKPIYEEEKDVEKLFCIFLDSKNKILAIECMFKGSIGASAIYPRELVKKVIKLMAVSVIIVHNHPSGVTTPSPEDEAITLKIFMALSNIDVILHDHVIIGDNYYSMAEAGTIKALKEKSLRFYKSM